MLDRVLKGFEINVKQSRLVTVLTLTRRTLVPEKLPLDHGDFLTRRMRTYSECTSSSCYGSILWSFILRGFSFGSPKDQRSYTPATISLHIDAFHLVTRAVCTSNSYTKMIPISVSGWQFIFRPRGVPNQMDGVKLIFLRKICLFQWWIDNFDHTGYFLT
jgi:hypothetical protein